MATKWINMTANMMVEDVNQTVDFYRDLLGFEVVMSVPESGKLNWAMVKQGSVELMLEAIPAMVDDFPHLAGQKPAATISFYIHVEALDELHRHLQASNVKIIREISTTAYGAREFVALDCNGYILNFSQAQE
jgi:uncharacterized glyoxalase superfamily protein PhnB